MRDEGRNQELGGMLPRNTSKLLNGDFATYTRAVLRLTAAVSATFPVLRNSKKHWAVAIGYRRSGRTLASWAG